MSLVSNVRQLAHRRRRRSRIRCKSRANCTSLLTHHSLTLWSVTATRKGMSVNDDEILPVTLQRKNKRIMYSKVSRLNNKRRKKISKKSKYWVTLINYSLQSNIFSIFLERQYDNTWSCVPVERNFNNIESKCNFLQHLCLSGYNRIIWNHRNIVPRG